MPNALRIWPTGALSRDIPGNAGQFLLIRFISATEGEAAAEQPRAPEPHAAGRIRTVGRWPVCWEVGEQFVRASETDAVPLNFNREGVLDGRGPVYPTGSVVMTLKHIISQSAEAPTSAVPSGQIHPESLLVGPRQPFQIE